MTHSIKMASAGLIAAAIIGFWHVAARATVLGGDTVSVSITEDGFGNVPLFDQGFNPLPSPANIAVPAVGTVVVETLRDIELFFADDTLTINDVLAIPADDHMVEITNLPADIIATSVLPFTLSGGDLDITVAHGSGQNVVTFSLANGGAVPEPATLALFGSALLGLGVARRRKRP